MQSHLDALKEILQRFPVTRPRVYGSVLRGTDTETSDLDLLVDPLPEATLFQLVDLRDALEALLGVPVDVRTPGDLPERFRAES